MSYVKRIIITSLLLLMFMSALPSHAYSERNGIERGDDVRLAYRGVLKNGTVFDPGSDDTVFKNLDYGNYIDGFVDEVLGMKIGEKKTFEVPPEKGYTSPNHYLYGLTLIFTVEILGVEGYDPAADTSGSVAPNFLTSTFRVLGWVFGIIFVPVLLFGVYRFINESLVNRSDYICSIGGEKADGVCSKCGTPYCRSHFIKGCPQCHGVTLQPK